MGRPQKYDEIKLTDHLSQIEFPPLFLSTGALNKYNELGPLDFKQLIDRGNLTFISDIKKSDYKQIDYGLGYFSAANWSYYGQVPH